MAEDKKSITLLEYIRAVEKLIDPVNEDVKVSCRKCRSDFRSVRRWEIDEKIVLRQLSDFGSMLTKRGIENAIGRMTYNSAFEPKVADIIDSYTGKYTYFCRGSMAISYKNTGLKYFFQTNEQIRKIFVDPVDKRTYAVGDKYLYDLFTRTDTIFICPLNTSLSTARPITRLASFFMKDYTAGGQDSEIAITPI